MFPVLKVFGLLPCPFSKSGGGPLSIVIDSGGVVLFACREELDGGVSPNSELLSRRLVLSCVHFGDFDLSLEVCSQLCPLWSEGLAMTTPGSIELDEPGSFVAIDVVFEVAVSEDNHVALVNAS